MLLIKFMFTLIYYGSFIYTVYKVRQIQQEYSDIMALYKQERERTFPNLTEQEQKKRKKTISQYYEKKDPSFALKRKFSFLTFVFRQNKNDLNPITHGLRVECFPTS
ncbi:hypothetical protein ACGWY2_001314 [Enterococcus hirae]